MSDVFPALPFDDFVYQSSADIVFLGDNADCPSLRIRKTNIYNIILSEAAVGVRGASRSVAWSSYTPPLGVHIPCVIKGRASKKVFWVAACRIVARVADELTAWFMIAYRKGKAMGAVELLAEHKMSVFSVSPSARPCPTRIRTSRFINSRPKGAFKSAISLRSPLRLESRFAAGAYLTRHIP